MVAVEEMRGLAEVAGLHGDHRDLVLAELLPQHRRRALHGVLKGRIMLVMAKYVIALSYIAK